MYSQFSIDKKQKAFNKKVRLFSIIALACVAFASLGLSLEAKNVPRETLTTKPGLIRPFKKEVDAYVTGYNTVPGQTDASPCIAANGKNICGRTDAVACPRHLPFGTKVEIRGKVYECVDRTSLRYNGRFDISCDKDTKCPSKVTGWTKVKIL